MWGDVAPMRNPHKLSRKGAKFIGSFEGLRLTAYRDPVGILTIGYGHTGPDVRPGQQISRRKALQLLRKDAGIAAAAVHGRVKVALNQAQFDALVSFTYNVGTGGFASSTLLQRLNAGRYRAAADQLLQWDKAGGSTLPGLTRRRAAERRVFLHGYRRKHR